MNKNCIINVACRTPYTEWQARLIETCNLFDIDILSWTDCYPPDARTHHESLYGFKIYAFKEAFRQGYENVLWLDSPCFLLKDPTPVFEHIATYNHYLVHGEDMLKNHCNDETLAWFGVDRDLVEIKKWRLLSGSCIGLARTLAGMFILDKWEEAEKADLFLSAQQDCENPGHRHDESCLSLIAGISGYKTFHYADSYFQNENAIIKSEKW